MLITMTVTVTMTVTMCACALPRGVHTDRRVYGGR